MGDDAKDFILMFLVLALVFILGWFVGVTQVNEGKHDCERNLPRNQQCVIKWAPEEKR